MMKYRNYIGLLMIAASLLSLGWADSFEAIRTAAGKITSIQADFIQEKHMAILVKPLTAAGHFVYKAPDSLRWEYTRPVRSLLLMHGGTARRFTQTENGLTEDASAVQYMDVVLEEISKWMAGRFEDTAMFKANLLPGGRIVLTPRDESTGRFIQRIELTPADEPGVLKSVTIYESRDSYTRFTFVQTRINESVSDDIFRAVK
jgi:outer membrane lipoprotein-sorting protein